MDLEGSGCGRLIGILLGKFLSREKNGRVMGFWETKKYEERGKPVLRSWIRNRLGLLHKGG